jgi:hypothetical protein
MKLVITLLSVLLLEGCQLAGEMPITILQEKYNRDKTKGAILFLKEGGATVADSYQVSVFNVGDNPSQSASGNVFIVDDNHGSAPLDANSLTIAWLSNDSMQIEYDKRLRTFLQEKEINGVLVMYQTK